MKSTSDLFKPVESLTANWSIPTNVRFGVGRINELVKICQRQGFVRPLLVTDKDLLKLEMTQKLMADLKQAQFQFSVFSEVKSNPTEANVMAGVQSYKQGSCDSVIAMGGGSVLDAGKAIALMLDQALPLFSYEDRESNWRKVNEKNVAPVIAIPTTAGTGSEVGRASVIVDEFSHSKKIIFHPAMMPHTVICDPVLTQNMPKNLTAATGMDALVHNLEAFFAPGFHPLCDGVAVEGTRIICHFLPKAYQDKNDLQARAYLLIGSSLGATAFQKGLGGVHALAHALGAIYDKHHGLLNAILLPYVLQHNKAYISEKMTYLARCLELENPCFDSMFNFLCQLAESVQIPKNLAEIGLDEKRSIDVARMAYADSSTLTNPGPISEQDYLSIYIRALRGN
jgi:alcohol dehydrogenase class IV